MTLALAPLDAEPINFRGKGYIIENGSHQQLLPAGSPHATLYSQQTRGVGVS